MKKKRFNKAKEVFRIKNHILKLVPYAKDIDIKIDKSETGDYESLIRVHVPPRKKFIAVKRSESLKVSLEKSRQAILRQVKKLKEKKQSKRTSKYQLLTPSILN